MNATANHSSDEVLEKYAMGSLSDSESASLEEHLLLCEPCRSRLDAADQFLDVMKLALEEFCDTSPEREIKLACVSGS